MVVASSHNRTAVLLRRWFYFKTMPLSSKGAAGSNGILLSGRYFLTCRRT
ncbi:MAG: hypothetical protein GPOALKHO_001793 [Sodalis sp.]|nr:MAG: hypothetical protein GPOALKHO_001793 [Sodalis sp.]